MRTDTVGSARRRATLNEGAKHAFILIILFMTFFPLYVMLEASVKDNKTFLRNPWVPTAPSEWRLSNWSEAWTLMNPYIANSIFVAVLGTAGTLVLGLLAAYFFARYKMPLSSLFWSALMLLMLMPGIANLVPLFILLKKMHLLNTLWALVVVGISGGQVITIYILRNFIEDLPYDLFEAAEVDGAGHLAQLWNIVIPMSGPILSTLAILRFIAIWNDFILALVILSDKRLFTLGVGLIYLDGEYIKQWGPIMAAYTIAAIPLVLIFIFTMRLFVRGLSAGALKG